MTTIQLERIPHPAADQIDLATVLRTVGDPVRLRIVRRLSDGRPRFCGELGEHLGLPASTLSYHLRLLRAAGVTRTVPRGTLRLISLRTGDLDSRFPGLLDVLTGHDR